MSGALARGHPRQATSPTCPEGATTQGTSQKGNTSRPILGQESDKLVAGEWCACRRPLRRGAASISPTRSDSPHSQNTLVAPPMPLSVRRCRHNFSAQRYTHSGENLATPRNPHPMAFATKGRGGLFLIWVTRWRRPNREVRIPCKVRNAVSYTTPCADCDETLCNRHSGPKGNRIAGVRRLVAHGGRPRQRGKL